MSDIMVDIDDVIVPWFETIDGLCRDAWGHHHPPCRVWAMHEHYGVPREAWEDIVISATSSGLYTSTEPLPHSVAAVNRLRWHGHRVHIVTARGFMANGGNIRQWTRDYLHTFGIGHDTLTFAKDKVAAQDELGVRFDWAVDDGAHNYEALDAAGVNVWMHDAGHNLDFRAERRVASLWEFSNLVLAGDR